MSDEPATRESVKTEASDLSVTERYVKLHLEIGIDAMTHIGTHGEQIKHFKY